MLSKLRVFRAIVVLTLGIACAWDSPAVAGEKATPKRDWKLVRSVSNPFGGTIDLVLIPVVKQRDRKYYETVANIVCATRTQCMVNFWTDRGHIPKSAEMPVEDLSVMTASYERHPSYKEPALHLACWLYPSRKIGESMQCEYEPGAKTAPDK